jgi:3-dehydroquinate dehydratase-1
MLDIARGPFVVAVADRPDALARAAATALASRPFDLVEARVDLFPSQTLDMGAAACARLEATGTPVLVTIRTEGQGGRFAGSDADRLRLFRAALAAASWADVEDDSAIVEEVAAAIAARPGGGRLVISHHDFARTPPLETLLEIIDRCHAHAGAIAKVATRVTADADRETLLALLAARPGRTCVIGMAATAALRIELAVRGSLLAYGYLDAPTAPGQLSAAETDARLAAASPGHAARRRRRGVRT